MSAYKNLINWLSKTISRRQPRKSSHVLRNKRATELRELAKQSQSRLGYPHLGSLDKNFQNYVQTQVLPVVKNFNRAHVPKKTIAKPALKTKTVTGKQLKIPGMKAGGTLRKINGSWIR